VPDDAAAPRFTRLDSLTSVDADELVRLYDYPADLSRCWVRANMIGSVDGGATVEGRAGGLAGAGDRALFKVLREVADVVLVGAGTVRAENYAGAQMSVVARQARQARGQAEIPPIAVVTASGAVEPTSRLFTHTETPPLIFTTNASFLATRERVQGRADVFDASTSDPIAVDPVAVLAQLAQRGLHRVLCEGGPTLLGAIVECEMLDELALTVAPMLVAGGAPRIVTGRGPVSAGLRVDHILTDDDGYLYLRYSRAS
jgi:riboflavin biosynthesis pyrimidine reductase